MVCIRCIMAVKSELDKLELHYVRVELGEIEILGDISTKQIACLGDALKTTGLTPSHFRDLKHKRRSYLRDV